MELILHIGTPKTGTTALQEFFYSNYNELLNNDILYPKDVCHNNLVHYPINWAIENNDTKVFKKLKNEIKRNKPKTVIVSSEMFTAPRFHSNLAIGKVRSFFTELGFKINNIKVVIYFRRQDEYCESIYNEMVKNHNWSKEITQTAFPGDYYYLLQLWAQFFTKENIYIGIYNKNGFKKDIFNDFLNICNLKDTENYIRPHKDPNPRLTDLQMEILRLVNKINFKNKEKKEKVKKILLQDINNFEVFNTIENKYDFNFNNYPIIKKNIENLMSIKNENELQKNIKSKLTMEERKNLLNKYSFINQCVVDDFFKEKKENLFE